MNATINRTAARLSTVAAGLVLASVAAAPAHACTVRVNNLANLEVAPTVSTVRNNLANLELAPTVSAVRVNNLANLEAR